MGKNKKKTGKSKNKKNSKNVKKIETNELSLPIVPKIDGPKISVITCTQIKRIPFVKNLARMITNQNKKIHEWVIVNGCTTDEDHDKFNEQVREITCEGVDVIYAADKNLSYRNIGAFRNLGNRTVTGDIIICMDDDDYYS